MRHGPVDNAAPVFAAAGDRRRFCRVRRVATERPRTPVSTDREVERPAPRAPNLERPGHDGIRLVREGCQRSTPSGDVMASRRGCAPTKWTPRSPSVYPGGQWLEGIPTGIRTEWTGTAGSGRPHCFRTRVISTTGSSCCPDSGCTWIRRTMSMPCTTRPNAAKPCPSGLRAPP